jgi:sortase A
VTRVIRGVGWVLVVSGVVVLLYVVYLLWFTGLETQRAQQELAETWSIEVPEAPDNPEDPAEIDISPADPNEPVEAGDAYAAMWFERNGERIVGGDILYVVEGVTLDVLRAGPGHYPDSDVPGGPGNFAIAGHRTTYGAPFWSLDELRVGDTIHVVDRQGREWVYAYREQQIVDPTALWVVGDDPLGTGAPTITLTTCHPRGSARQRLIAWGELIGDPSDDVEASQGAEDEMEELPET